MNRQERCSVGHAPDSTSISRGLPSAELRGRLTCGGRHAQGVRIRLEGLFEPVCAALQQTDREGSFRIAFLPEGCYELRVGDEPPMRIRLGVGARVDLGILDLLPRSA